MEPTNSTNTITVDENSQLKDKKPVILAFLQNQWFKDPEKVKSIYERYPHKRNHFIREFLFMGCQTGKRIMAAFGEDLCYRIIWEDASPELGNFSASKFKADHQHIKNAIDKFSPNVLICFGKIAEDAVKDVVKEMVFLEGKADIPVLSVPHPAARFDTKPQLIELAGKLNSF